jgi:hypothetical protein
MPVRQEKKAEIVKNAVVPAAGGTNTDAILNRANALLSKRTSFGSRAGTCSTFGAGKSSTAKAKDTQTSLNASDLDEDRTFIQEFQFVERLKEALWHRQRRCKEVEAENLKLNEAFQKQHQEIQQLREAYEQLESEHQLLSCQFHLADTFSAAPGSSSATDPFAVATANALARARANLPRDLQSFLDESDDSDLDLDDAFGPRLAAPKISKELPKTAVVVARCTQEPKPSPPLHLLDDSSSLPNEFFCPITCEIMTDPVVAVDGYTYELEAILKWFKEGRGFSPMTKEKLQSFLLVPNRARRAQIILANDSRASSVVHHILLNYYLVAERAICAQTITNQEFGELNLT